MGVRLAVSARLAQLSGALSRRAGRGAGTSLPGTVLLRLDPAALRTLGARLPSGAAMVSATNGKTTTAAMIGAMLGPEREICRNAAGANLAGGIATALLERPAGSELAVLEVDEAALPALVRDIPPRVLALGNLFRDQLDRYGELEMIADRWRQMVATLGPESTLVVNADDPVLDDAAALIAGAVRYGIDDPEVGHAEPEEAADSTFCVRCGAPYAYAVVYYGHLGDYACAGCGHRRGPLDLAARAIRLDGVRGTRFRLDTPEGTAEVRLPLPGLYNVANALAAFAVARELGVSPSVAAERLATMGAAFGRFERIVVDEREAVVLLIKNPAGANEALRTIADDLAGATLVLALNDRIADGRDVSWIWDVDFEIAVGAAARVICSGDRAADMALRVRYADVPADRIEIVERPLAAFDRALADADGERAVYVLPTYTAMLDLRRSLAQRGVGREFWEDAG